MNSIHLGSAFQLIPIHVMAATPWRWPSRWRNPKAKFVLGQENLTGKRDVMGLAGGWTRKNFRGSFWRNKKPRPGLTGAVGAVALSGHRLFAVDTHILNRHFPVAQLAVSGEAAIQPQSSGQDLRMVYPVKVHEHPAALVWLEADLAARHILLEKNSLAAVKIHDDLQHWQSNPDLSSVREAKQLANLPAEEKTAWQKLWADVQTLR